MDKLLILLGLNIVTALIAWAKGLNPFVWFLIGTFLGPIGLILLLVKLRADGRLPKG